MKKFEEEWVSFSKAIIPTSASKIQYVEMRKAFFAGAYSMLRVLSDLEGDEEAGARAIEAWKVEIEAAFAAISIGVREASAARRPS